MDVVLKAPVYRGWFTAQEPKQARVGVQLRLREYELKPSGVRLTLRLRDAAGKVRQEIAL